MSGSTEYPTPAELYAAMIDKLLEEGRWEWVTFEVGGEEHWVQVALSDRVFDLNFAYPFEDEPLQRLRTAGIAVRPNWTLNYFQAGQAATLAAPENDHRHVAQFVHEVFRNLLGCPENFVVSATVE